MTAHQRLSSLEAEIRQSVQAGAFTGIQSLLGQYRTEVEQALRSLPPSGLPGLRNRTEALFEWTDAMLRASRCLAAAQLVQLQTVARYRQSQSPRLRAEA